MLEHKVDEMTKKFNALLNIVEKNFPPDVELYFELYGKEPN